LSTTIKAKNTETGEVAEVEYDFGVDVDAAVDMFGGAVVHSGFVTAAKIAAQNRMRELMKQGKTPQEAEAALADWKPGVKQPRAGKDPVEAFLAKFGGMSDAERAAVLGELQAVAQG